MSEMMSFKRYLTDNYPRACQLQRDIVEDATVKAALRNNSLDVALVTSWMTHYNLFQGRTTDQRRRVAMRFLRFAKDADKRANLADRKVLQAAYAKLFRALYDEVNRSWMSATSKLLWCIYPDTVAIYDSFVERALIVMQVLDDGLARFPRIGSPPSVKSVEDIAGATAYYLNYSDMVRHLFERHTGTLNKLRKQYNESYPHDIRIIDKMLWMIGSSRKSV